MNHQARAGFLTSPALETLFAVCALLDPSHHPHLTDWAAELQAKLTEAEQAALALLRQLPHKIAFSEVLMRHDAYQDPLQLAALIGAQAPDVIAHDLLGEFFPIEQVRQFLADPAAGVRTVLGGRPEWMGGDPAALELVLRRPGDIAAAYALLLPRVWEDGVKPRLPQIEELWETCLAGLKERAETMTPRELANQVFSRPFAYRFGPGHDFDLILFIPSYFASPHKAVLFSPTLCIAVADCRLGAFALQQMRDDLAAQWKAITDPTRLEILRHCAQGRQYGQWLASLLKLKPATVAHHLEVLRSAGLLEEEMQGATKYHRLRRERLTELTQRLQDFIYGNI